MSYSFGIRGVSKAEAIEKMRAELDKVVETQASHKADRQAAQDAGEAFVALLREPDETENIVLSMSGRLGWSDAEVFTSASVDISAYVIKRA